MKDPDHIDTIFRIADWGIPLDMHDNYYKTFDEACEGFAQLYKMPESKYSILEITTVTTEHDI